MHIYELLYVLQITMHCWLVVPVLCFFSFITLHTLAVPQRSHYWYLIAGLLNVQLRTWIEFHHMRPTRSGSYMWDQDKLAMRQKFFVISLGLYDMLNFYRLDVLISY